MDLDLACHLSIITGETDPATLGPILRRLRELGYRRAVLAPMNAGGTDVASLRDVFAEHDVTPIAMCGQLPGADVSSAEAAERAAGAALLRETVDFAAALGADQLNGTPYGLFGKPTALPVREVFERSAREVGAAADYAADSGVQLTFEVLNRYEEGIVNTAAQALDFVAASGSDNLGIHLDTFHMAIEEADMGAAIRLALPKLKYLELGQSARGDLATGAVDVSRVVRDALDAGYDGRIGIEAFSRPHMAEPVADMLSIWRDTFSDGLDIAARAITVIRAGWETGRQG
jgi:D-psicose/D-tagatose/L-ribulose 3-epimerase